MNNMDNRVRYTKMILQQALLKLLQTKHIDKITIKELCEEAQVNRGTFYLHYTSPNELLMEIEQQFIDEHMVQFSPYLMNARETTQLAGLFTSILTHKDLCRVIMGKNGNPRFLERLQILIHDNVIAGWRLEFPDYDPADLEYVYDFLFTGSMRLILNWIEDDQSLPAADLARRLDRLGHYCHLAILEFHPEA